MCTGVVGETSVTDPHMRGVGPVCPQDVDKGVGPQAVFITLDINKTPHIHGDRMINIPMIATIVLTGNAEDDHQATTQWVEFINTKL